MSRKTFFNEEWENFAQQRINPGLGMNAPSQDDACGTGPPVPPRTPRSPCEPNQYFDIVNSLLEQNRDMLSMLALNNRNALNQNINIVPDLSKNIENFDGESDSETAERWLQQLIRTANLHNWPEEYLFETARSHLRGAANYWYRGEIDQIQNWATFSAAFKRRFLTRTSMSEMWRKMRERVQKPKENVSLYFHEKIALCRLLNLDFDEIKEQVATGSWSRDLTSHVLAREHYNEDQLFQDIVQFERVDSNRRTRFESKTSMSSTRSNTGSSTTTSDRMVSKLESSSPSDYDKSADMKPSKTTTNSKLNFKCFKCGEKGHLARDCPVTEKPPSRKSMDIKCFKCGKPGHRIQDCEESTFVEKGEVKILAEKQTMEDRNFAK